MVITVKRLLIFLAILGVAGFAGASARNTRRLAPIDTVPEHLKRAAALEQIGFYKGAETELLAALAGSSASESLQITKNLQRVREAAKTAESVHSDQNSEKFIALGKALEENKRYDQALTAFQRAYNAAASEEAQALARTSINRVLEEKESWWEKYIKAWALPGLIKFVFGLAGVIGKFALGLLGAIGLYVFLSFAYSRLDAFGKRRAEHSNRIEVGEFDDTTDSGFGKAFPAVLHTVYEEYQNRAHRSSSHIGSVLLAYRGTPATLPVMGSPKYEDFSEINLILPGLDVSEFFRKVDRLLRQPYYRVGGAIYRLDQEIRSAARLTKYNGQVNRWDRPLWSGPGSTTRPASLAYDIIATILDDWNA